MYYNEYDFDSDKNYLIYFRGCFCPPTRGHFSLVEKYVYQPNVKYLIHQIGSEKRHGVPYWLNRKIWKIYISELLPKNKIVLKKMGSCLEVLDYIEDIDVVILIKGNERVDKRKIYDRYALLRKKLKRRRIKFDFLIIDRPELNTLSATRFVEAIDSHLSCREYVPEGLSQKGYKYIISQLRKNKK